MIILGHIHKYLFYLLQTTCGNLLHDEAQGYGKATAWIRLQRNGGSAARLGSAPAFCRGRSHQATPPANPEQSKSICHISEIMAFSNSFSFFSLCLLLSDPLKCRRGTFSGFSQESETQALLHFFFPAPLPTFFFMAAEMHMEIVGYLER